MDHLVPTVAPLSKKQIERDALEIIQEFYPGLLEKPAMFPVLDFFDHKLVEDYQFETGVKELPLGIEGVTFPDNRVFVSEETYCKAAEGDGRARFTVAHECYHGIRHAVQIRNELYHFGNLTLHRRRLVKPYLDPEWQANHFARCVLLPEQMVRLAAEGRQKFTLPAFITRTFGVSFQVAQIRLSELGLS